MVSILAAVWELGRIHSYSVFEKHLEQERERENASGYSQVAFVNLRSGFFLEKASYLLGFSSKSDL